MNMNTNTRRLLIVAMIPLLLGGSVSFATPPKEGWILNWQLRDKHGEFVNSGNYVVKNGSFYNSQNKLVGKFEVRGEKLILTFDEPAADVQGRGEVRLESPGKWSGFYEPSNGNERRRLEIRHILPKY